MNFYDEILKGLFTNLDQDTIYMKYASQESDGLTVHVTEDTIYWCSNMPYEGNFVWKYKTTFEREDITCPWTWSDVGSVNCLDYGTWSLDESYIQTELIDVYTDQMSDPNFWDDVEQTEIYWSHGNANNNNNNSDEYEE